jgi:hypothetical protein
MVMVRAHTLDFVPLAGSAGWSVSAEKGGGHVWWRARLDERGKRLTLSDGDWSGDVAVGIAIGDASPEGKSIYSSKAPSPGPRIVLFEACSAFTCVTACTLALPPYFVARFIEGFNRFVTSTVAPVASGWSISPGGTLTHWDSAALSRRTPGADPLAPAAP